MGVKVFNEHKYASCYIARQHTGFNANSVDGFINDQTIWSYTDLLLHYIGPIIDTGIS